MTEMGLRELSPCWCHSERSVPAWLSQKSVLRFPAGTRSRKSLFDSAGPGNDL